MIKSNAHYTRVTCIHRFSLQISDWGRTLSVGSRSWKYKIGCKEIFSTICKPAVEVSRDCDWGTNLLHPTPWHQLLVQNRHTETFWLSSKSWTIQIECHLIFWVCPATQRWYWDSPGRWQVPAHCSTSTWLGITCKNRCWGGGQLWSHLQNGRVTRQGEGDKGRPRTTLWKGVPHLGACFLAALFDGKGGGHCGEGGVEGQEGVGGERHRGHAQEHWVPPPPLHVEASTAREMWCITETIKTVETENISHWPSMLSFYSHSYKNKTCLNRPCSPPAVILSADERTIVIADYWALSKCPLDNGYSDVSMILDSTLLGTDGRRGWGQLWDSDSSPHRSPPHMQYSPYREKTELKLKFRFEFTSEKNSLWIDQWNNQATFIGVQNGVFKRYPL